MSWGALVIGEDGIPVEQSPVFDTREEAEAWAESRRGPGRREVLVRNWARFTEWSVVPEE